MFWADAGEHPTRGRCAASARGRLRLLHGRMPPCPPRLHQNARVIWSLTSSSRAFNWEMWPIRQGAQPQTVVVRITFTPLIQSCSALGKSKARQKHEPGRATLLCDWEKLCWTHFATVFEAKKRIHRNYGKDGAILIASRTCSRAVVNLPKECTGRQQKTAPKRKS